MDASLTTFPKPTTLAAVKAAGIALSEPVSEQARLIVACYIISDHDESGPAVLVTFGIEIERASGGFANIMAELDGAEDQDNVDRAEALFGASEEDELRMVKAVVHTDDVLEARSGSQGAPN